MPPPRLDATVALNKLALPSSTKPKSAPALTVELRTVALAWGPTTTPMPLLPTTAELSRSRAPESPIPADPAPPACVSSTFTSVSLACASTLTKFDGNGSTAPPSSLAPGPDDGPTIEMSPLIVNVDAGRKVPALSSMVLEPPDASALATAA